MKRHRSAPPASIAAWWAQAVRQADAAGLVPLLAYRADRQPWRVVIGLHLLTPGTAPHTVTLSLEAFAAITDGTDAVIS